MSTYAIAWMNTDEVISIMFINDCTPLQAMRVACEEILGENCPLIYTIEDILCRMQECEIIISKPVLTPTSDN